MRGLWVVTMMLGSLMALGAQEHPGKPVEHPGKPAAKVTAEDIRKGIQAYIAKDTQLKGGYFLIWDEQAKRPRVLQLVRVHDKLNKLTAATLITSASSRRKPRRQKFTLPAATFGRSVAKRLWTWTSSCKRHPLA